MKKYKRRQFIVDKKLQFSFMFISFLYIIITIIVLGTALFMPLVIDLYSSKSDVSALGEVADKILYLNTMFWPAVIFLVILICSHTIYETHKIAGPIFRFRGVINRLIGGDLTANFKLRDGDYLYGEMDVINELINQLRARISDIKDDRAAVHTELSQIMGAADAELPEDVEQRLRSALARNENLEEKLEYFRVEKEPEDPGAEQQSGQG